MPQEWSVVAASVVGVSHERAGINCQDAYRWLLLPDGALATAVADGAGSAPLADVGAAIAVEAALAPLTDRSGLLCDEKTAEAALWIALRAARDAVETEAATRGVPSRDLASTLIVMLAGADRVAAAQLGDGAVVVADRDGAIQALTRPPAAEYANETIFLTSPEALSAAQLAISAAPVYQAAIFTDGLQRLALNLPEGEPHVPFFAPLFRFAAATEASSAADQLTAFLRSPRIAERADDDLTLLLATGK